MDNKEIVNALKENISITVRDLIFKDDLVGKRYIVCFGPFRKVLDYDIDLVSELDAKLKSSFGNAIKTNTPIKGMLRGNLIDFDDCYEKDVVCAESIKDFTSILNYCKRLAEINLNFRFYIDKILDYAGHGRGEDQRYNECKINTFSCRFYGGYKAWTSEGGLEDDDFENLDMKYCKDLSKAIEKFNKEYKLNAYWQYSEKNWVYIYIC